MVKLKRLGFSGHFDKAKYVSYNRFTSPRRLKQTQRLVEHWHLDSNDLPLLKKPSSVEQTDLPREL